MRFHRRRIALVLAVWLVVLVVGSCGLVLLVANASAAPNASASNVTATTTAPKDLVGSVDDDLSVVSYGVDGQYMWVKLESHGLNYCKISDFSGVKSRGFHRIPSKQVLLHRGETRVVRMHLEQPSLAMVGIATVDGGATLGKRHKPMFGSSFSVTDVRLVGLTSLSAALCAVLGAVFLRRRSREKPERVR